MSDLLPSKPLKGTRDFYPEDMRFRNWMFGKWREVCERYGYGEVDGPILEPLSLYVAKTSEEIVGRQLYKFTDQGNRELAVRPEFTPTVARLAASRIQELPRPIRWYGIPNVWRYEASQRGRLREHWQLNVDIFGCDDNQAEIEIICLAQDLLTCFGAPAESFEVKINSRKLTNILFLEHAKLKEDQIEAVSGCLDKRSKIGEEKFEKMLTDAGIESEQITLIKEIWDEDLDQLSKRIGEQACLQEVRDLFASLEELGYGKSVVFDSSVMRGFTYYTGIVFEVFDKHPDNNRSLFGGGRYDNLVGAFSKQSLSGIGFGMGDVTFENFLVANGLKKEFPTSTVVQILLMSNAEVDKLRAQKLATRLRAAGLNVAISLAGGKMGKQIASADKQGIKEVIFYGEDEESRGVVTVKNLNSGEQQELTEEDLIKYLQDAS
jgi:histidyl-tRNA synthetase